MRWVMVLILVCVQALPLAAQGRPAKPPVQTVTGRHGMVVCESSDAARVGVEVLRKGGSAVDAAVAVALAMAVTWPEAGNIGGGGFMMVSPPASPQGEVICVDYRETAPTAATPTMFGPGDSRFSHKAVGVPGTVRGLAQAHSRFGKLPWRDLVLPAVALARDGFVVDEHLAWSINDTLAKKDVATQPQFAELRRVFGHPDGRPWHAGDRLVQPELARTLQQIADDGPDAFYTGTIAAQLTDSMARHGGLITTADLAAYRAKLRPAVHFTFRGYDIHTAPPPSSGGTCLAMILQQLEAFDLSSDARFSPRTTHLVAESMRRAFRQRAEHLGDPDFVSIPTHLTGKSFALQLSSTIDPDRATASEQLAPPIELADESPDTTHFSVIDASGMAVSNTYTLEQNFGSRMVVEGAGFVLNNEMGDFNWTPGSTPGSSPGHANRMGRISTPANNIAPGKRMLSSTTPTIVKRDGKVVLVVGSPGGRTIINTVANIALSVLAFDMPLAEAVQAPRMHQQWFPDRVQIEPAFAQRYPDTVAALKAMGHTVELHKNLQGSAHAIAVQADGTFLGVADFRRGGAAAGY